MKTAMILFLLIILLYYSQNVVAATAFNFINDNEQAGNTFSLNIQISNTCSELGSSSSIVEIALTSWAGNPEVKNAIDLSPALISVTANGTPLSGSKRTFTHPSGAAN